MREFLLALATTTTLAANVRWPPQLNEQNAGVIVRGHAVSVVSQRGCFSIDGRPCAAAVPHTGDDDDGALSGRALRERGVRRPAREETVLRQITHY